MCTAVCFKGNGFYFGRTLDYETSYGEEIVVLPRNATLDFCYEGTPEKSYAIIGTAHVSGGYPLFYDAANECGLCMAGLNFVGNAKYNSFREGVKNAAQYEFLPWVLRQCKNVSEARRLIENTNITDKAFNEYLPAAQLHWLIADKDSAITVEATESGINIYDNPAGVLANNPPFPMQLTNLANYSSLSRKDPVPHFADGFAPALYSRGMGGIGLPGDVSSMSRFVRAAFVRMNSVSGDSENESVNQFFHILGAVEQVRGECELADGKFEITIYSSCCNADKGIYYYTTYEDRSIRACDMHASELDGTVLCRMAEL